MGRASRRNARVKRKYTVALSFAAPERQFANAVAHAIKRRGVRVFYDDFETHVLWGKNLNERLRDIYAKQSRYCIMLLSDAT